MLLTGRPSTGEAPTLITGVPALPPFDAADLALLDLLAQLDAQGYRFTTITPASHARVLGRRAGPARSLADVFGWSLPFAPGLLPEPMEAALRAGGMLDKGDALHRAAVRVSSVRGRLFLHSAHPTVHADAVFLGPDSYRFADLIAAELGARPVRAGARVVDIGVGSGVGLVTAAALIADPVLVATDPNAQALRLAGINAAAAGFAIEPHLTSGLDGVTGPFDLVLLNPPFIVDAHERTYRHGGGMHGGQLSLDLARAGLGELGPRGRLILYTGSAIVDGEDALGAALAEAARAGGCRLDYRELDPDIFGEELDGPAYAAVDRIALVAAVFRRD